MLDAFHEHKIVLPARESFLHSAISLDRPKCFKVLLDSFSQAERLLPSLIRATLNRADLLKVVITAGDVLITQELLGSSTDLDTNLLPDLFTEATRTSNAGLELTNLYKNEGGSSFDKDRFVEKLTEQLAIAVRGNDNDAVTRLVQRGADIDRRNVRRGQTPLYDSAYCGYREVIETSLKAKADTTIAADNSEEWLPIHAAYDSADILRHLLAAGADVDARTKEGATVLYLATKWGYQACVEEILKNNPKLDFASRVP